MKIIHPLTLFIFLMIIIGLSEVYGKEMEIDATDYNGKGENNIDIMIGEIEYKTRIEFQIVNHGNVNNISAIIFNYRYEYANENMRHQEIFSTFSGIIQPGESGNGSFYNSVLTKYTLGLQISSHYNESAYNDQQRNVIVEYHYQVYNDRGNLISSESSDNNESPYSDSGIEGGCCSSMLVSSFIVLLLIFSYIKWIQKSKVSKVA